MSRLQDKIEDSSGERQRLVEKIKQKESMVENKRRRLGGDGGQGEVWISFDSEISRWKQEIRELRARLSEVDADTDRCKEIVRAYLGEEAGAWFDYSELEACIREVRSGKRQEQAGRKIAQQAESKIEGICFSLLKQNASGGRRLGKGK